MKHLILDGSTGKAAIHDHLAQELRFPDWYGRNLDALYDCLTEVSEDVRIELVNLEELDFWGRALQRVILDAALSNPHIHA